MQKLSSFHLKNHSLEVKMSAILNRSRFLIVVIILIATSSCSPISVSAAELPTPIQPIIQSNLEITPEKATLPLRVPVLVLAYYPPAAGSSKYLDYEETGWSNLLIVDMQAATREMITAGQALINDATRYHGHKDPNAPQYLEYYTYEMVEFFYPMPRGFALEPNAYRPNYNQIFNEMNICDYVDNHGVKEVWIYGYHSSVIIPDESKMSSKYGDISNALPKDEYLPKEFRLPRCDNAYVMYNFTYQPGGAQSIGNNIHNRMHQIENVVFFSEGAGYPMNENNINGSLFWDDFSVAWDRALLPGYRASCGNTHSPPNTLEGYDYDSKKFQENNCETWNPVDSLTEYVSANCSQWGCTDIGFYKWFMQNMPGYNNGLTYKGKAMRNWWDAMYDFEKYIDSSDTRTLITVVPMETPKHLPVFEYPVDGQTLKFDGSWLFKIKPMIDAQEFMFGFFQNNELVWENMRDEGTASGNEYVLLQGSPAQNKFVPGEVEVWVRVWKNDTWSEATVITIYLEK